jgi:hypothetical protein
MKKLLFLKTNRDYSGNAGVSGPVMIWEMPTLAGIICKHCATPPKRKKNIR